MVFSGIIRKQRPSSSEQVVDGCLAILVQGAGYFCGLFASRVGMLFQIVPEFRCILDEIRCDLGTFSSV